MCVNCVSQSEVYVGQALLVAALLKRPAHNALASLGLVAPIDDVARDVDTIAFLRAIDLDPVEILGYEVVAAAEAWRPLEAGARRPAFWSGAPAFA
jgi:hypothetical protein